MPAINLPLRPPPVLLQVLRLSFCVNRKVGHGRNGIIGRSVVSAAAKAHKFVLDYARLQRMIIIRSAKDQATTSETAANSL